MNFIFICGRLEPGKDGVGDYSRRLAGALVQLGHAAALVALAEPEVPAKQTTEQTEDGINLSVLRLYKGQSWAYKKPVLEAFINTYEPDVLSLQYVPYAFQAKGLPFRLAKQLSELNIEASWHIMFHELWLGIESGTSYKNRTYGLLQKAIIKSSIKDLQPNLITTHSQVYQFALEQCNIKTQLLPLFGNITPIDSSHPESKCLTISIFGGIYKNSFFEEFISWLQASIPSKEFYFQFLGANGKERDSFLKLLDRENFNYKVYGWLENEELSRLIGKSDIGLSTAPFLLSEKSGSVAAFLDHNVPVISIGENWRMNGFEHIVFDFEHIQKWTPDLELDQKPIKNSDRLMQIVNQFLEKIKPN